jgi:hypothetical protein
MYKKFVIHSMVLLVVVFAMYGVVIDQVIVRHSHPVRLSHWLLENSAHYGANKIVISAGSNARHGFDAIEIEKSFNKPAIIFSEDAGIPLRYRLYTLSNYMNPGDTLILPLEWVNYFSERVPARSFLTNLFGNKPSYAFYYKHLPLTERLAILYSHLPSNLAMQGLLQSFLNTQIRDWTESDFYTKNSTSRGGIVREKKKASPAVRKLTCDEYLFGRLDKQQPQFIHEHFTKNLVLLNEFKSRGIHVVFAWPTVVNYKKSSPCYTTSKIPLEKLAAKIVSVVNQAGYDFVGHHRDSLYSSQCFLDTYYHIKGSCSRENSKLLIERLKSIGVKKSNNERITETFNLKMLDAMRYGQLESLKTLSSRYIHTTNKNSGDYIANHRGWFINQKGSWISQGNTSELSIKLSDEYQVKESFTLTIDGDYIGGMEPSSVTINGKSYGENVLKEKSFIVPIYLITNGIVTVELKHNNQVPQYQPGSGKGKGRGKFILNSLAID